MELSLNTILPVSAYSPNNASIKSSSTEQLTSGQEKPSRWSGIEVNPLYDVHSHHKRRKSLSSRLFRQMSFGATDKSPHIFPKHRLVPQID